MDFSKGKVIYREDSSSLKKRKIGKVKNNFEELEQFILKITNDENNLEMTNEEKEQIYRQHCYRIYKITNYKQQDYYIKDVNQTMYLKEVLSNLEY